MPRHSVPVSGPALTPRAGPLLLVGEGGDEGHKGTAHNTPHPVPLPLGEGEAAVNTAVARHLKLEFMTLGIRALSCG
jgi:hypothetical protein